MRSVAILDDDCMVSASGSIIYIWSSDGLVCDAKLAGHDAVRQLLHIIMSFLSVLVFISLLCYQDVNALAVLGDGKTIVSGSRDSTIRLWDSSTGTWECQQTLTDHSEVSEYQGAYVLQTMRW